MKILIASLLLTSASSLLAEVTPTDLRCEYRQNPMGIDIPSPRLSWVVSSSDAKARGVMQSAYRVIVASSKERLARDGGDLWDTGRVESSQSIHVAYSGKPVTSGTRAFWKVRLWDEKGKQSPWSNPAMWSMGLLDPNDWSAKWIGHDESTPYKNPRSPFRYLEKAHWIWSTGTGPEVFEKKLNIPDGSTPRDAMVVMSADHTFELSLNGERVGGSSFVRAPAVWDIARYLKTGENSIVVKASPCENLGAARPNAAENARGLIAAFHIEFKENKTPLDLVTDTSWSAATSSVLDLGAYGIPPWGEVGYTEERALPARMLRKEFEADRNIKHATAYISGLGLFEFYLNGSKIGDQVLSPGLTDYDKRVQYVTFDVTSQLKPGRNAIGLILGNGRFWAPRATVTHNPTRSFGYPKARMQLEIQ